MTTQKECPMCGERMSLQTRETVTRVPGSTQEIRNVVKEWICRECDYFEDADDA
jgi:transposase